MANNITLSYPSAFHHQFLDRNGKPLTGGKLYTYSAGTPTPIPTYKTIGDISSTNTNTNPIILDNAGMAYIVIETDKAYKFVLFDKNDAKIAEWDNVTGNIGGGGGGSEDIVVVGTPNEIDVSGSVIQGVKRYVVSLSNSVKITILQLIGLYNNVLNSLGNKADKVQGATAGNFASLDASGNLTDSGSKSADFKTKQTPVADPSAIGAGLEFIDSVSQDANGEITPHKKAVQDGTTAQKGVVKLNNAIDSTSTTEAATPKAVKDSYDELNNKIVARAVFLSQAEWAVQSQLEGDPAKVYYVENGTGEDAYTVYVWRESTSTYEEVDESSIDLDGYWHDSPTTTGSGNVVTNITLGNDGVPQVEKGLTALTQHQSVTDNDPTLAWGTRSKVGTIGGTDLHVTMPSNPASGKLDSTGDASNTTSTFTKASGDTSTMTSGGKLSVLFTAISSFFASLKALAFKDKASYNDLSSGVQSSLDKAESALQYNSASQSSGAYPLLANNNGTGKYNSGITLDFSKASAEVYSLGTNAKVVTGNTYVRVATIEFVSRDDASCGITGFAVMRDQYVGGSGEAIFAISCADYGDETPKGKLITVNARSASTIALSLGVKKISSTKFELWAKFDRYQSSILRISINKTYTSTVTWNNDSASATQPSGDYYEMTNCTLVYSSSGQVGSPTTPVYVNSNGQVQPCDVLSGSTSNFNRTFTTSYTVGSTDQYITTAIKNDNIDLIADYVTWHNANVGKLTSPPMIIITLSARTAISNAGLITLNMYKTGNGCDVFGESYTNMGNQHGSIAYNTQYFTDQTFVSGSAYYLNIRNETPNTMWAAGTILDISIRIVAHAVSVT